MSGTGRRLTVLLGLTITAILTVPANAVVIGVIDVAPAKGTDATLFSGVVDARCPTTTADSYFSIDGPGLPHDQAILAPGNTTGAGRQAFTTQAIANIKAINSGSFLQSGTYTLRFNCVRTPDGKVTNTYERALRYVAGGSGSWTLAPAPAFSPPPPRPAASRQPSAGATSAPSTPPSGSSAPSAPGGSLDSSTSGQPGGADSAAGRAAPDDGPSPALVVGVGAAVIGGLAGLATIAGRRRRRRHPA